MSPRDVIDEVAPPHDVGITIRDGRSVRQIKQSDLKGALRIERGGPHRAALIAAYRHYDGATGGEPGYYANVFVAWRSGSKTFRSGGVRILPFESPRIARSLDRGIGSKPGAAEPDRIGGTGAITELIGVAIGESVLLFVRFGGQGGKHYRSRGVEIHENEREIIAKGLRNMRHK